MLFENGQTIVFIGDSITDCGRRADHAPYGNGYVSLLHAFITARYPDLALTWHNRGIGGNTVRDLAARWDEDAIALRPDWLAIKIGINDIWRRHTGRPDEAVPDDEFEATLRHLAQRAIDETGCRLIIAEPYVIETDPDDPQLRDTRAIGLVARRVANDLGAINVRTQDAFDRVLQATSPADWAADRVHPNQAGHAVIAQAFLRAIDFEL